MLSQLSGPFYSIILCVFAGIALRYALWFGSDNNQNEQRQNSEDGSSDRVATLEEQLKTERQSSETLTADYKQLCNEFDRYRQDATTRESELRTQSLASESLQSQVDELSNQVSTTQEANKSLTAQLQSARQAAQASGDEMLDELTSTESALVAVKEQLTSAQTELATAVAAKSELQQTINQLQTTASQAEQQFVQTERSFHSELDSLKSSYAAQLAEQTESLHQLRDEKDTLESRCAQLAIELETKTQSEAEKTEHVATLSADARFVEDLRHQLTGLQAAFKQRTEEVDSVTSERDAIGGQVSEMAARLEKANQEIGNLAEQNERLQIQVTTMQTESETLAEARTSLASDLESLQRSSTEQLEMTQELVGAMQTELDNTREQFAGEQQQLIQLQEENAALIKEITSIRTRSKEELTVAYDRVQALESDVTTRVDEAHEALAQQIKLKEVQLHEQLRVQEANAAARFGAVEAERVRLQEALEQEQHIRDRVLSEQLTTQLDAVQQEHEGRLSEASQRYEAIAEQVRDLQTEKEALLNGLHGEQDLRAAMEQKYEAFARQNTDLQSAHESATTRANQVERRMSGLMDELNDAENRLAVRDAAVGELRVENRELLAQLEREKQERTVLQRSLGIHAETLEKLRADSASLETLLERQARVQSSLQQHTSMLRNAASSAPQDSTTEQHKDVGVSLEDHEQRIADERSDESSEAVGVYSLHTGTADAGIMRVDPILGNVYATPPEMRDDLKLISGIGEGLEKKMNRLGVYRFEQIMRWDDHAVTEFSNILAFKDRIVREEWVEQAGRLFHEHHGIERAA